MARNRTRLDRGSPTFILLTPLYVSERCPPAPAQFSCCTLPTPGRAHHGAQPWDSGYQCEQRLTEGRLGPLRPSRARNLGRARARPLHFLSSIPKPQVTRRADRRHLRPRGEGAADKRTDENSRLLAQISCAGKETCEHGRAYRAP